MAVCGHPRFVNVYLGIVKGVRSPVRLTLLCEYPHHQEEVYIYIYIYILLLYLSVILYVIMHVQGLSFSFNILSVNSAKVQHAF